MFVSFVRKFYITKQHNLYAKSGKVSFNIPDICVLKFKYLNDFITTSLILGFNTYWVNCIEIPILQNNKQKYFLLLYISVKTTLSLAYYFSE